jgi:hypothetical protein
MPARNRNVQGRPHSVMVLWAIWDIQQDYAYALLTRAIAAPPIPAPHEAIPVESPLRFRKY